MTSPPAPARRRALLRVAALAAAPLAGATALPARAAGPDLSNVTLVLGDQAGGLRALAEAARVLDGVPYRFRWANFQGAAPLFEAQRAGAIDLAPAGDLPVLTAALGDPALRIVATRVGSPSSLGIVVQPDSPVRTVADLKGRTVVVSSARGSISQYQLYGALREHGLAPGDVDVRFVLPVDAFAAFEAKQIGIWATFDPYYGNVVRRGARIVRDGSGINSGLAFLTSPVDTLDDRSKRAALSDVLARLTRAGQWALAHPADYA
ncbi:ABC transporter substrate-binding protein, partial [Burkholderia ambifaria]